MAESTNTAQGSLHRDNNRNLSQVVSFGNPAVESVSVGATAVQLDVLSVPTRIVIEIQSIAANTDKIYIGFSNTVTVANGRELQSGREVTYDLGFGTGRKLWAIAASGTQDIRVTQI